jgi:hypothetical protein
VLLQHHILLLQPGSFHPCKRHITSITKPQIFKPST